MATTSKMETSKRVRMVMLDRQYRSIKGDIDLAMARVLARGVHVLGAEVERFEREWAAYCGTRFCVAVGSGTSAIEIALKASGLPPGTAVSVSPVSAFGTVAGIKAAGGRIVFGEGCGWRVPVHLYGTRNGFPYDGQGLSRKIYDACQCHGLRYPNVTACWSFYPTKNLGCFGDGGAITTNDQSLAIRARALRNYGESGRRYVSEIPGGVNSRLDEIQAAVLMAKLPHLKHWNARRAEIAARYEDAFAPIARTGALCLPYPGVETVWHQYVVNLYRRDDLREHLEVAGIETGVHYPLPLVDHPALAGEGDEPVAHALIERARRHCRTRISLPIAAELTDAEVARVIEVVRGFFLQEVSL